MFGWRNWILIIIQKHTNGITNINLLYLVFCWKINFKSDFNLPLILLSSSPHLYKSDKNFINFLAKTIAPYQFKSTLLSFTCLLRWISLLCLMNLILHWLHMFTNQLFTSFALLFKLSAFGAISIWQYHYYLALMNCDDRWWNLQFG